MAVGNGLTVFDLFFAKIKQIEDVAYLLAKLYF
jgi:hypothetical protein